MELNIMPLQALQNNKSRRQHYTPGKRQQSGSFAALLGLYTAAGDTAVKRHDGFGGKSGAALPENRPAQSDMNLLLRQICRVNNVIAAMME